MKLRDINYIVSFLLLIAIMATGATGYIQAKLELRGFIPHRWFAYAVLILSAIHIFLNFKKLWNYTKKRLCKGQLPQ